MLRVGVLIGLVAIVAALSRLNGHTAARPVAAAIQPLPRAATVVKRGMTEAEVRRLAGRPAPTRGLRRHCLLYAARGPNPAVTFVCFGRTGRVSSVRTGHLAQLQNPSDA
jgi:hypothetical protein